MPITHQDVMNLKNGWLRRDIIVYRFFVKPCMKGFPMKNLLTLISILFFAASSFAADISETDVKAFLDNWLSVQNTGSYSSYATMYSNSFIGIKRSGQVTSNLNHDAWLKDRKKMFNKKMVVEANNPEIKLAGTTASIKFEQTWASGTYKDKGDKLLDLALENGKLKITREEMLFSNVKNTFTSVYTDLKKDCKDKFSDSDEDHDMPVICKGPNGYKIDVEYSACCEYTHVASENKFILQFPEQRIVTVTKRTMEWRLVNEKPFAVIFRIDKYKGDITLSPKKSGEVLLVKGLNGFSNINYEVNIEQYSDPIQEARRLADQGYLQLRAK